MVRPANFGKESVLGCVRIRRGIKFGLEIKFEIIGVWSYMGLLFPYISGINNRGVEVRKILTF